jgi:hypothetical protein
MSDETKSWRELAPGELAAEPDAKFGGELAALFIIAVLAMAALPTFLIVWGISPIDLIQGTWTKSSGMFSSGMADAESDFLLSEGIFAFLWGVVFVVSTVLRWPYGASFSAGLLFLGLLFPPTMWLINKAEGWLTILPHVPHLIICYVGAGAFTYYIRQGRQPNLYFGRRVRV